MSWEAFCVSKKGRVTEVGVLFSRISKFIDFLVTSNYVKALQDIVNPFWSIRVDAHLRVSVTLSCHGMFFISGPSIQ